MAYRVRNPLPLRPAKWLYRRNTSLLLLVALIAIPVFIHSCGSLEHSSPSPPEEPPSVPAVEPPVPAAPAAPSATAQPPPAPMFPWPPPSASAMDVLSRTLFPASLTALGDVDNAISAALEENGYIEKSYFGVPDGFAMVTRLEKMLPDGRSAVLPGRWSVDTSGVRILSVRQYLRALFTADPGYYRVIVFIVTAVPFGQRPERMTSDEAAEWLRTGLNVLPPELAAMPFTDRTNITALIYEFEKPASTREATSVLPGLLDGRTHLRQCGFLAVLANHNR